MAKLVSETGGAQVVTGAHLQHRQGRMMPLRRAQPSLACCQHPRGNTIPSHAATHNWKRQHSQGHELVIRIMCCQLPTRPYQPLPTQLPPTPALSLKGQGGAAHNSPCVWPTPQEAVWQNAAAAAGVYAKRYIGEAKV
jgi:hypothetical protein